MPGFQVFGVAPIDARVGANRVPGAPRLNLEARQDALFDQRFGSDSGGDGGIRTLDTPLERITV